MNQIDYARYISSFFQPVIQAVSSPAREAALLRRLGFVLPDNVSILNGLITAVDAIQTAVSELISSAEEESSSSGSQVLEKTLKAIDQVSSYTNGIQGFLSDDAKASSLVTNTDILDVLPRRLFDLLIVDFLSREFPAMYALLRVSSIIEVTRLIKVGDPNRTSYISSSIQWEQLPQFISDPAKELKNYYGWGQGFKYALLCENIRIFALAMGLRSDYRAVNSSARSAANQALGGQARVPLGDDVLTLHLPLFPLPTAPIGVDVYPIEDTAGQVQGLSFLSFVDLNATLTFELSTHIKLETHISSYPTGLGILVRPNAPLTLISPTSNTLENIPLDLDLILTHGALSGMPHIIFGSENGTRLQAGKEMVKIGIRKEPQANDLFLRIELDISQAEIFLQAGDGDGFLQKVLPAEGMRIGFDFGIGWSSVEGIFFKGGASLEITFPIHLDLFGVLKVDSIYLAILAKSVNNTVNIDTAVAASIDLKLGPIAASVERMGLSVLLTFPPEGGNLGPLNIKLGFRPPRGVGLVIDAGAVVGGGYLFFDYDNGQYGGVLQIEVKGTVSIKIIGLITTKMPDGSPGFSLLFIITVEFSPIQLGYGFTLNGVGGLAGFNRTMNVDALRDGIKNRTLDSILFPPDPIKNARKIISDLQTVFPPAPNRFVFAPMVKLGWGAGMLLIEVGLAVELPWPLRLAILGKLHLQLPPAQQGSQQEENIIQLHMDVLGILDFDRGEVSVDAVLYDSLLVIFPITGGMAMRIRWGSNPLFMMSVGGLNPRFPQPPDFPTLDRLGLQLSYEESGIKARLRLISYFAVTPNTLQFGARLDAYVDVSKVAQIEAFMGFDALIEFHPFHFIVDLYGGVSVRAFGFTFGVDLLLVLSGPKPFIGDGHAIINFLGKHEVAVHFTIGEEPADNPALPPVDPLAELIAAFNEPSNWSASLPSTGNMLVTLRQLSQKEMDGIVLAHPLGELTVRQRVLPLGVALERFGASVPTTPGPFKVNHFLIGTDATPKSGLELRDAFAPGQFLNLSEDEKLTRPAFESFLCGQTRIGTEAVTIPEDALQTVDFEYEVTIIDDKDAKQKRDSRENDVPLFALEENAFLRAAQYGAASQTPMQSLGSAKFAGAEMGIKVQDPKYVVAGMDDLQAQGSGVFVTFTEAEAARRSGAQSESQVVEAYEVI